MALYAALCALATFDRDELHKKLIKNLTFKDLLDTVPEVGAAPCARVRVCVRVSVLTPACMPVRHGREGHGKAWRAAAMRVAQGTQPSVTDRGLTRIGLTDQDRTKWEYRGRKAYRLCLCVCMPHSVRSRIAVPRRC